MNARIYTDHQKKHTPLYEKDTKYIQNSLMETTHPVTTLVTAYNNPDKLTNDLLTFNSLTL